MFYNYPPHCLFKGSYCQGKKKKERMCFAPFVTEVAMEKLTFHAGLKDGKLLEHASEATSTAFRHETSSTMELKTISFDYVIFRISSHAG